MHCAMSTLLPLEIPADHAAFSGHFPGNPIVPGVLLLDKALYTIAAACGLAYEGCTISAAKFLSAVHPGELLQLVFEPANLQRVGFTIRTPDRLIASGIFSWPARADNPHDR